MSVTEDKSPTHTTVVKLTGYLEKKVKLSFIERWKKCWCVLQGQLLLYYKSHFEYLKLSPCRGSLNMALVLSVQSNSGHRIDIYTHSQFIVLRTKTTAKQQEWFHALLTAMPLNTRLAINYFTLDFHTSSIFKKKSVLKRNIRDPNNNNNNNRFPSTPEVKEESCPKDAIDGASSEISRDPFEEEEKLCIKSAEESSLIDCILKETDSNLSNRSSFAENETIFSEDDDSQSIRDNNLTEFPNIELVQSIDYAINQQSLNDFQFDKLDSCDVEYDMPFSFTSEADYKSPTTLVDKHYLGPIYCKFKAYEDALSKISEEVDEDNQEDHNDLGKVDYPTSSNEQPSPPPPSLPLLLEIKGSENDDDDDDRLLSLKHLKEQITMDLERYEEKANNEPENELLPSSLMNIIVSSTNDKLATTGNTGNSRHCHSTSNISSSSSDSSNTICKYQFDSVITVSDHQSQVCVSSHQEDDDEESTTISKGSGNDIRSCHSTVDLDVNDRIKKSNSRCNASSGESVFNSYSHSCPKTEVLAAIISDDVPGKVKQSRKNRSLSCEKLYKCTAYKSNFPMRSYSFRYANDNQKCRDSQTTDENDCPFTEENRHRRRRLLYLRILSRRLTITKHSFSFLKKLFPKKKTKLENADKVAERNQSIEKQDCEFLDVNNINEDTFETKMEIDKFSDIDVPEELEDIINDNISKNPSTQKDEVYDTKLLQNNLNEGSNDNKYVHNDTIPQNDHIISRLFPDNSTINDFFSENEKTFTENEINFENIHQTNKEEELSLNNQTYDVPHIFSENISESDPEVFEMNCMHDYSENTFTTCNNYADNDGNLQITTQNIQNEIVTLEESQIVEQKNEERIITTITETYTENNTTSLDPFYLNDNSPNSSCLDTLFKKCKESEEIYSNPDTLCKKGITESSSWNTLYCPECQHKTPIVPIKQKSRSTENWINNNYRQNIPNNSNFNLDMLLLQLLVLNNGNSNIEKQSVIKEYDYDIPRPHTSLLEVINKQRDEPEVISEQFTEDRTYLNGNPEQDNTRTKDSDSLQITPDSLEQPWTLYYKPTKKPRKISLNEMWNEDVQSEDDIKYPDSLNSVF